ncbi:hypothetical protein ACFQJ5_14945 [Halomicroarcula sp. GCM10025324]|uniref:hypothetical protein n=1 Tax=Haloarcula TaxID=2237 RepID=UPI0023E75646|nr:hypothetical protein [Halomicroarcula sp. ZS-22-S1]
MPEITLTESQHEQLEAVRADVEDAFVETYGHARLEDAVDYLLDTYTPPNERDSVMVADGYERIATAEYPELQHIAADVPDIPGSGIDADEMRGKLLSELGPTELAARLADGADEDAVDGEGPAAEEADGDGDAADAESESTGDDEKPAADESTADADADSDDPEPSASSDDGESNSVADAGNALSMANKLLREHDDKWRRTDSGEEPYEVDLPDGTTEGVRTKDDVRQYLFKNY